MLDSSTDWSPLSGYQTNSPYSAASPSSSLNPNAFPSQQPKPSPLGPDTPPISVHSSANSSNVADGPTLPATTMQRLPLNNGNPSPPSSITGRSSIGTVNTGLMDDKKYAMMEAALAEHHRTLLRYLAPYLRDLRSNPQQNRARDKLLRLSMSQFQELSTDVYDELTRREDEKRRGGPDLPGNPVPKYLLPRTNFHFKRNQARQKLSTLPQDRFQQLATDVFFELERRFPRFARSPSRAESIPDRNSPSRNGFPPRTGSRQGPDPRSGSSNGFRSPAPSFSPPGGPGGPPETDSYGKPLPKMYQSNVMVPNKGTMVEDDGDAEGTRMLNGRSNSNGSEYRVQVQALERKVDELVSQLQEKDKEIDEIRSSTRESDLVSLSALYPPDIFIDKYRITNQNDHNGAIYART
jgi:Spa2 Homology Domain (SHD)-containing protein